MRILAVICIITMVGIFDYRCSGPQFQPRPQTETGPNHRQTRISEVDEQAQTNAEEKPGLANEQVQEVKIKPPAVIKTNVNFEVPFTSQAPFSVWDDLHNEACEEAALVMAKYWLSEEKLTKEKAEKEILDSIAWQNENWGGHYDLPAEKIVELGKEYFKIEKIDIIYQPTLEDIKEEISKGNLVIVPTAGRLLKNPYYRQPGPIYHLLVVRGYDDKLIITNDPGTKRGENFKYTYQNFFDSIHDWPYGPPDYGQKLLKDDKAKAILNGQKAMIVVEK